MENEVRLIDATKLIRKLVSERDSRERKRKEADSK